MALLCLYAAGCSHGGAESADPPETTEPNALAFTETTSTVPAAEELRIGVRGLDDLDPVLLDGSSAGAMAAIDLVHRSLTAIDADDEVVADAARRWSVNEAGTVWRFELASDVVFSDGSVIQSRDVVRSIRRSIARAPRHMTTGLDLLDGAQDARNEGDPSLAVGVDADGDRRVVFRLTEPDWNLPRALASPVFGAVKVVGGGNAGTETSGPYDVTGRNGEWRLSARGADLMITSFDDDTKLIAAVELDSVDAAFVAAHDLDLPLGVSEIDAPSGAFRYAALNVHDDALGDVGVRRAILAAIDPRSVAREVGHGSASVGKPLCPVLCPKGDAAAMVGALGDVGPVEVLHVRGDGGSEREIADLLSLRMRDAGLDASAAGVDAAEFATRVAEGDFQVALLGAIPSQKGRPEFLRSLMASDGSTNVFGLTSEPVDEALRAFGAEGVSPDLAPIADATVMAPLFRDNESLLLGEGAGSIALNADGTFDLGEVLDND